ncbi:MAG: dihydroneopterin aldolase [Bacillota bacterium]
MGNNNTLVAKGMYFWGNHGATKAQNVLGTIFEVDIIVEMDMNMHFEEDKLSAGLTYTDLYILAQQVITQEHHKTLERVAQRIVDDTINVKDPSKIYKVSVSIRQPYVPFPGSFMDGIGVTLIQDMSA